MARSSFSLARVLCQPEGTQDPRDKSRRDGPQIEVISAETQLGLQCAYLWPWIPASKPE
jgi:hypothetical protein